MMTVAAAKHAFNFTNLFNVGGVVVQEPRLNGMFVSWNTNQDIQLRSWTLTHHAL